MPRRTIFSATLALRIALASEIDHAHAAVPDLTLDSVRTYLRRHLRPPGDPEDPCSQRVLGRLVVRLDPFMGFD
jgi:hypothetical protein